MHIFLQSSAGTSSYITTPNDFHTIIIKYFIVLQYFESVISVQKIMDVINTITNTTNTTIIAVLNNNLYDKCSTDHIGYIVVGMQAIIIYLYTALSVIQSDIK